MAKEISIRIGHDEEGNGVDLSLTKSPHILVGGTTGSGKSNLLHNILTQLIVQHQPEQLRLFVGDPKRVEFHAYTETPHADMVARTAEQHVQMLDRLLQIMETRYEMMEHCVDGRGMQIQSVLHEKIVQETDSGFRELNIPNIVAVVDELGCLALDKQHGKRITEQLVQLTQLGRAAGINLIMATQNPVVKVIDSRIKANSPTRIALKVSSRTNSRVILDRGGAENLAGAGDALVISPFIDKMIRLQSVLLSPEHITLQIQLARYKYARRTFKPQPQRTMEFDQDDTVVEVGNGCRVFNFQSLRSLRDAAGGVISPN